MFPLKNLINKRREASGVACADQKVKKERKELKALRLTELITALTTFPCLQHQLHFLCHGPVTHCCTFFISTTITTMTTLLSEHELLLQPPNRLPLHQAKRCVS